MRLKSRSPRLCEEGSPPEKSVNLLAENIAIMQTIERPYIDAAQHLAGASPINRANKNIKSVQASHPFVI